MEDKYTRITLRIPRELHAQLELESDKTSKSLNAEIVARLEQSFSGLSSRKIEIANRLQRLLDEINRAKRGHFERPSHLAQAIGEDNMEHVEGWFLGTIEPTFDQLNKIATHYGIEAPWLIHGDGTIFKVKAFPKEKFLGEPKVALDWLYLWDEESPGIQAHAVRFVRESSDVGSLIIVKESESGLTKTFTTTYHVSEHIGSSGESDLARLFLIFELMFRDRGSRYPFCAFYILDPVEFAALRAGNTHPIYILNHNLSSTWGEDIWDENIPNKYWNGFKELRERILNVIEKRTQLREIRDSIRLNYPD